MKKGIALVAVFACELRAKGLELGRETIARCLKAIEVCDDLRAEGYLPVMVLSAGKDPLLGRYPLQEKPIAEMMIDFIEERTGPTCIIIPRLVWGTAYEVEAAVEMWEESQDSDTPIASFHEVTSWYHVPRVWWYTALRHRVRPQVHTVWKGTALRVLGEFIKPPGYVGLALLRKLGLWRGIE